MFISVPAQTDSDYSVIASNQCSWAALEFVLRATEFRQAIRSQDTDGFVTIYKKCLLKASQLRAQAGKKHLYGENIDTPELLTHYTNNSTSLVITDRRTIMKNTSEDFLEILHPDLKREFYSREYAQGTIEMILSGVHGAQSVVVSRHGQSLAIIPCMGRYLVCDSHLHHAMILSREDTQKHIMMDEGGHLHLTAIHIIV